MGLLHVVLLVEVIAAVGAAPVGDAEVTVTEIEVEPDLETYGDPQDGYVLLGDMQIDLSRNAVFDTKRWPGGVIPYVIDSNYTNIKHDKIMAAIREIEHDVNPPTGPPCITFVPRTTEVNYINIYPGTGCSAAVGMTGNGKQGVSLGTGCEFKGLAMHELMHAIGFWHEMNRYDRDDYININFTNITPDNKGNYVLFSNTTTTTLDLPYDISSIMHYGPYDFTLSKTIPVLSAKGEYDSDAKMGQTISLTKLDVQKIQRLYDCPENTSHITTPLKPGNAIVDCNFGSSICTLLNDTTGDFEWVRESGASDAVPKTGNTVGADPYLVATAAGHHGVAKIRTPPSSNGPVCLDMYLYHPGPSSYLTIALDGPHNAHQVVKTFEQVYSNSWVHYLNYFSIKAGTTFQLSFDAHIDSGDIAIDDLHIYHGPCAS